MSFGENLKLLRQQHGLKQDDVADILNVTSATISRLESNIISPTADVLVKLSAHYNISTDFLLKNEITAANSTLVKADQELMLSLVSTLDPDFRELIMSISKFEPKQVKSILNLIKSFE